MTSESKETGDMLSIFLQLPNEDQDCILEQHYLVLEEPVILHPSLEPQDLDGPVGIGIALLQLLGWARSALDQQLLRLARSTNTLDLMCRARKIFYGRNDFIIWWHGLANFIDGVSTGADCSVADLVVRNVTVRYNLREDEKYGKDLVTELERLFCLQSASHLTLEIIGGGTAEGSDMKTQQLLKDVCSVVKRLIAHFGTCFNVQKGSGEFALLSSPPTKDLTSYWDEPISLTREKVHKSIANFEETMQVQVETWLGESSLDEGSDEPIDWDIAASWKNALSLENLALEEITLLFEGILPQEDVESLSWEPLG
ncbi:hypothetical protein V8C42DRAFT_337229 [Trichoderma barbatum]